MFLNYVLQKLRSGTTGVTALIAGNTLHVAWLGDSQVMMVRQGQAVNLMDPHKPEKTVGILYWERDQCGQIISGLNIICRLNYS